MTLSITLQTEAQNKLNTLFDVAIKSLVLKEFARTFCQPTLIFTQRGKIAGSALLHKNTIKLNPTLYAQNFEYFLSQVIAHELSHILVYQLYGLSVKPHGLEWKKMMLEVFGIAPKVTHSLDVSQVAMRTVSYKCACQRVALSMIRHNRVVRGTQRYICKTCNEVLIAET